MMELWYFFVFFFITLKPVVERYTKSISLRFEPEAEILLKDPGS